jgi:hypothetical protein
MKTAPDRIFGIGIGQNYNQSFNTGWVAGTGSFSLNPNGIGFVIMRVQGGNILDQLIYRNLWNIDRGLNMRYFPTTVWNYQIQRQPITLLRSFMISIKYFKLTMSVK